MPVMGKSQIKSQSYRQKDVNLYAKSHIKLQITSPNHKSFLPKSQITISIKFKVSEILKVPLGA